MVIATCQLVNIVMPLTELAGDNPNDQTCRTFVFDGEGHTLGNALRCVISRYPDVQFCGYTVPHPSENKINFRIQTSGPKAVDVLRRGFADLQEHTQHIATVFKTEVDLYNDKCSTKTD